MKNLWNKIVIGTIFCAVTCQAVEAQVVEKVADLTFSTNSFGEGLGGYVPLDRFTQSGSNLWFTTSKGGLFGFGTISKFDLSTRQVVQVASMDNETGTEPESSILIVGDEGYFTTTSGGAGARGTISKINLTDGTVSNLFSFPPTTGNLTGASPRGGLTKIGDELWTTTASGGVSNRGTIVKLNLTNGVTTLVTNLDGPKLGGQAYETFLQVGADYYYTTLTGGSNFASTANVVEYTLPNGAIVKTTNNLALGGGILGRMNFDSSNNPTFTQLLNLRGGFEQFSGSQPVFVGTNSIYFNTVGAAATPGALVRYDISTGFWTNLFVFATNSSLAGIYGRQPGYNGITEWQNELYFMTRQGGVSNFGIIAKFNIASNTVTKLADLRGVGAQSLGNASGSYNTGTIVEEAGRFYIYYPVSRGGVNFGTSTDASGYGTIVRVVLPPPPITTAIQPAEEGFLLSWTGGYAPFSVQLNTDLGGTNWTDVATNLTDRSLVVSNLNSQAFFRISGQP